ncbi:hypothetical protein OH779_01505 [Actinacidiphila glaucinigra]|uniref:hypothetical protein n=1 Tax=Actinacidiphila glaucinigra TaxID=235986 RepID=UPI00386421E9
MTAPGPKRALTVDDRVQESAVLPAGVKAELLRCACCVHQVLDADRDSAYPGPLGSETFEDRDRRVPQVVGERAPLGQVRDRDTLRRRDTRDCSGLGRPELRGASRVSALCRTLRRWAAGSTCVELEVAAKSLEQVIRRRKARKALRLKNDRIHYANGRFTDVSWESF